MASENVIESDVLVIGGGMAGCFSAIKAKEQGLSVTLVDKGYVGKTGATHLSEGDIRIFNPEWGHNFNIWMDQINRNCEYINNRQWTEIVLKDSYERYKDLVSWGIKFYYENGKLYANRGMSIDAGGQFENISMINREYSPALRKKLLETGVKIIDRIMIGELMKQDGMIVGAIGFNTTSGDLYIFKTKATIIAAGGSSLKEVNKPTHYWTSDGEAMAYRAGAEISGKEFKFGGGTALRADVKQREKMNKVPPVSEVDTWARYPGFRGDGMALKPPPTLNAEGGPVISGPWEAHSGRAPVYVDLDNYTPGQLEWIQYYFRRVGRAEPDKVGFDLFKRGKIKFAVGGLYVAQSLHGGQGIWPINTQCATALPGLFAAGNSCATMLSGAGYAGLGSGLIHAAVTGARAGLGAVEYASKAKKISKNVTEQKRIKEIIIAPMERKGGFSPAWVTQIIQSYTVPYFILQVKHEERLKAALTFVEFINKHLVPQIRAKDPHDWRLAIETKNMALNAEMMLRASLFRTESRGSHFREDYPRRNDPTWLAWVKLKDEQGKMKTIKQPIPKEWWPDLSKPYEERYPRMFPGE
jgi:succinate dehydrogenase/fumarate reductase flavoprotein subunit